MLFKKYYPKRIVSLVVILPLFVATGCSNGEDVQENNPDMITTANTETMTAEIDTSAIEEESFAVIVEPSIDETTTNDESVIIAQEDLNTRKTTTITTTENQETTKKQEQTTIQETTKKQGQTTIQETTKKQGQTTIQETTKKQETITIQETTNHIHSFASTITYPTCIEQGYTTYTCSCGKSYVDDYVNALGHTIVIDSAVQSTYTSTGLTEGSHCSVCNQILVAQEIIPKDNIEWFETSNIVIKFEDIKNKTYSHGEYSMYCDYQIIKSSIEANMDKTSIDHNFTTSYDQTVSFTFTVKVKAITGLRYMCIPYEITNSKGEVLKDYYDGYTNLGQFLRMYSDTSSYSKGVYYTFSDTICFPAVPETYTITFLNPSK